MNAANTQCPSCYTRFKVTPEQLSAHNGMVRCGKCSAVFDANDHLSGAETSAANGLQIEVEEGRPAVLPDISEADKSEKFFSGIEDTNEVETLFQQIDYPDDTAMGSVEEAQSRRTQWTWIAASLLLLLLILAQAAYFFRAELAARLPGLKPALTAYCGVLGCKIPLPQKVDLLGIESSDFVADPKQENVVMLTALLRNRASFVQAYPNIQLSLTDTRDRVMARRIFVPKDYLAVAEDEDNGLGANREANIQLHLDTGDLRPMGYKLLLFFPPKHL